MAGIAGGRIVMAGIAGGRMRLEYEGHEVRTHKLGISGGRIFVAGIAAARMTSPFLFTRMLLGIPLLRCLRRIRSPPSTSQVAQAAEARIHR